MPNKAFKSDSQRLAVSLRSSIAKRCSHLNAALVEQGEFSGYFRNINRCISSSLVHHTFVDCRIDIQESVV
ncbi:hypothetical protein D6Y19_24185 [Vibrio parahaemolyticus]|nr:hypothetical protein [Vibrio parahaemolyticus]